MTYPSDWFDQYGFAIQCPPLDCVKDCSSAGRVDEAVDHWVRKLKLTAPPWLLRRYLRRCGAWDAGELCDHEQNLRRLLWTWCCDIRESAAAGEPDCVMSLT